jgi:hypothetical protein
VAQVIWSDVAAQLPIRYRPSDEVMAPLTPSSKTKKVKEPTNPILNQMDFGRSLSITDGSAAAAASLIDLVHF